MARKTREKYTRQRKPVIVLVCEGRNKTESKYFNHFIDRDNPYNLKIYPCEATDPLNMAKKAKLLVKELQLDNTIGDRIFCLADIDLSQNQIDKINKAKNEITNKSCKIEFILSNPCFEVWLLYYFTSHPKPENSSQKVKEQLKKFVPQYTESYDIVKECNLFDKYDIAINNSKKKNIYTNQTIPILERNPYTEVQDLIDILISLKKKSD